MQKDREKGVGRIVALAKEKLGIEELNEMQRAVAECRSDRLVLLSPTGSGKTLAFAIALARRLRPAGEIDGVQAVVMTPSRELTLQVAGVLRALAPGQKTVALYGGHDMTDEVNSLRPLPAIVVATPGRLLDHLRRDHLSVEGARTLVLDEYDKMLDLGFNDDMRRIVRRMKHVAAVVLTSATQLNVMPEWIDMGGAATLDFTGAAAKASPRSRMDVARVVSADRDKLDTLEQVLDSLPERGKTLVFVNHRESAERVYNRLKADGYPAGLYHGALDQQHREMALEMLANGTTPMLATTDLAARGLDIEGVETVVHYHMPPTAEAWTHRNGRTARVDADGRVIVITSEGETVPDYVDWDHDLVPAPGHRRRRDTATLYINAGRKEKVSRGDVAGYMIHKGGLRPDQVGRIDVKDHYALVAVPASEAAAVVKAVAPHKLKNTRVRVSIAG